MSRKFTAYSRMAVAVGLASASLVNAQVSSSAYRVLGQVDLQRNGLNMVQGAELRSPGGVALDTRGGQTHVYVADTGNSRVLAWSDAVSYQIGDPPTLILGQPGPGFSGSQGIGSKGFNSPLGLAVDPTKGNLYVADFGNNRVLRFPSPFNNVNRVEPDAVYGQPNFTTLTAAAASSSTLSQPRAVAFDLNGNLWVADSGNNRMLRFSASVLDSTTPPAADTVIGQKDFISSVANSGGTVSATGFQTPSGVAFDVQGNLYVADLNNFRVLRFFAPVPASTVQPAATGVWGQINFTSRVAPSQASASAIGGPGGIAVDGGGNLYVAVANDNRVLQFSTAISGGPASLIWGQTDFTTTTANTGSFPQASANSLSGPSDVKLDGGGNLFVADQSNNRIVEFPAGTRSASKIWGQNDFTSNGPNQIKPGSVNYPYQIAIDYSQQPFALYVSDTGNNRVLVWKDSVHFRNGDAADLVIGQPSLRTGAPNIDTQGSTTTPSRTSLFGPTGIAVTSDGTLYVADFGNNRVLRYPRPVNQSGRITPDAVIGQADFNTSVSALVSASSLKSPGGLAIGPNGDLFVADNGNNRVLEFPAGAGTGAAALRVYGQPSMSSSLHPTGLSAQTLSGPRGLSVDRGSNLYVADTGANRVVIFPNTQNAPASGMAASFVIGTVSFAGTSSSFNTPAQVATDSSGIIYVSDFGNNRVLVYPSLIFLPQAGATAAGVLGQQTISGTSINWDSSDGRATPDSLWAPVGLYVDRQDTLYVGDTGNSRLLQFLKPAAVVNAASYQVGVPLAQGSLATLFGSGLVTDQATASGTTWPAALLNRQIVVNDQTAAPVYFINQSQANFQVPSNAPLGVQGIAVRVADTGELVAGGSILIQAAAPGIFTSNAQGSGQGAVLNQNFSVNSSSNPAAVGSTISIYATGQGQVSPSIPDGTAAPTGTLSNTVAVPTTDGTTCLNNANSICVAVGSTFAPVQFSGLAPGFIGLWQINVTLPQGVATGNAVPVRVVINGSPSNIVTVAIR